MASKEKNSLKFVEIIPLLLGAFGLIMVFSASSGLSVYKRIVPVSFWKQIVIFVIALGIFFLTSKIKPRFWEKLSPLIFLTGIVLLVLTFVIGKEVNYARRWIFIGNVSFQPSILAQLALVVFLAKKRDFRISIFAISATAGLIMLQPDISMAFITIILGLIMLFLNGTNLLKIIGYAAGIFLLGSLYVIREGYAVQRITSYLNPESISGTVRAISNGGFLGLGLGSGMEKFFYIPLPDSDFIFSIVGEELGFTGALFVISLFLIYFLSSAKSSIRAKTRYASSLGFGLIAFISLYSLIHILVSVGVIPVTGVPLPFISSGGTALLGAYTAGGIIVSIERNHSNIRWRDRGSYIPRSFRN